MTIEVTVVSRVMKDVRVWTWIEVEVDGGGEGRGKIGMTVCT